MARPGAVLLLLLVTSASAVRYRWLDPVSLHGPAVQTVSAVSAVDCGRRCEAQTPQERSGFIYRPEDGTCRLFSGDCRGPAVNSSQQTTERYMARVVAPGSATDRCACPAGFSRCAGRCLQRLNTKVNYTTAESQCAALGAHVAVPRSDAENQCAVDTAVATVVWLGVLLVPGVDGQYTGVYTGADGCGPVPISHRWGREQPDIGPEDRIILSAPGSGHWIDWHDNPASALWLPLCQLALDYHPDCP
ncbi:brevican core protein-like [Amphibalanus amphitrite]|uniref:brevican core protein-like n=1 Tax=Amphibalanus amphitrite TaxID=1232801 RepID=UPI001C909836|nr:brevican core protein-like [Amphibalanus amphitrite]